MGKSPLTKFLALVLVGLPVFLIYLFFTVGVNEIMGVLGKLDLCNYLLYYTAALAAVFLSTLFYSMSWNKLMKPMGIKIGLKKAFLYCWLGGFLDAIIPFETVSGEMAKIYLVQRETGEQPGKIIASIVAHRIIVISIALGSLMVSSIFLITRYDVGSGIIYPLSIVMLGSAAVIALLLFASLRKGVAEKIINAILNFISFTFRKRVINLLKIRENVYMNLQYFYNEFRNISSRRWTLTLAVLYGFLAWLSHLSVFILTFYALGFSEIIFRFYETIVVYSISMALQAAPISIVAPGLMEIIMSNLYVLLGFEPALSGAATFLIRIATFWLQIMSGGIIVQWIGVKNIFEQILKNTSTC
ncbi:MAG: lysylphosphatidylglycerol synthase transmembrane domain-containing protein [Candidatus Bathyarchaeia archaeon]